MFVNTSCDVSDCLTNGFVAKLSAVLAEKEAVYLMDMTKSWNRLENRVMSALAQF